jgi:toxin YoeB
MSRPQFTEQAWEEYLYWHNQDKKTLKKINQLINDIMHNGAFME